MREREEREQRFVHHLLHTRTDRQTGRQTRLHSSSSFQSSSVCSEAGEEMMADKRPGEQEVLFPVSHLILCNSAQTRGRIAWKRERERDSGKNKCVGRHAKAGAIDCRILCVFSAPFPSSLSPSLFTVPLSLYSHTHSPSFPAVVRVPFPCSLLQQPLCFFSCADVSFSFSLSLHMLSLSLHMLSLSLYTLFTRSLHTYIYTHTHTPSLTARVCPSREPDYELVNNLPLFRVAPSCKCCSSCSSSSINSLSNKQKAQSSRG